MKNSLAEKLVPDLESSLESGSDSGSDSADSAGDAALRASLQREVSNRFKDMSPEQQGEWFRTRMQDPVFVSQLEKRQREMEEIEEQFLDEVGDEINTA